MGGGGGAEFGSHRGDKADRLGFEPLQMFGQEPSGRGLVADNRQRMSFNTQPIAAAGRAARLRLNVASVSSETASGRRTVCERSVSRRRGPPASPPRCRRAPPPTPSPTTPPRRRPDPPPPP